MDRLSQVLSQLEQLAAEARALMAGTPTTYPAIVTIDGATLRLDAPVAADWKPSMEARELTRYGSFGNEPSNGAQFGQALRSPAGYPMVYTPDGAGGFIYAWVNYNGVNFPDDAAVFAYKEAVRRRDAANARAGGTFSPGYQPGTADT